MGALRSACEQFLDNLHVPPALHAVFQAMLINSANLMGDSSEPGNFRGFGRIHLEAGMPLGGGGKMALFVADAATTDITEDSFQDYYFTVDATAGLDFRATLSWIDPPASSMTTVQLINDLDLRVYTPNGTKHTMWSDNPWDAVNVNERVIIGATDVTSSGSWMVRVRSRMFSTDSQSYSLVVTGAISPSISEGVGNETLAEQAVVGDGEAEQAENVNVASSVFPMALGSLFFGAVSTIIAWCVA